MRKAIFATVALIISVPAVRSEDAALALASKATLAAAAWVHADSRRLTIPAETEVTVQLLSGIHTRVSHVDDPVAGRLLQPLYVDGRVALPPGTLLYGRITRIQAAGRLHRPAELALRFEQIELPDNQMEPVTAVLAALERPVALRVDREGYLKAGRGFSWKQAAGGLLGAGSLATLGTRLAGTATLGSVLPLGIAGFLGYEMLWPHGDEVHLPPDTRCRVRFDYPLTVRGPS